MNQKEFELRKVINSPIFIYSENSVILKVKQSKLFSKYSRYLHNRKAVRIQKTIFRIMVTHQKIF